MQYITAILCAAVMGIAWVFGQIVRQCQKIDAYIDRLLSEVL